MLIVILYPNYKSYLDFLEPRFKNLRFIAASKPEELPLEASQAQVLICDPNLGAHYIRDFELPNLRWIQSLFAGVEPLINQGIASNIVLTNCRGMFGPLMSEYVFSYLLARTQNHQIYAHQQHQQLWKAGIYQSISQLKLVILGAGSIAQHLAKTAKHFGLNVSAINRTGLSDNTDFDEVLTMKNHALLTKDADVVVAVLPATPHTQQLCGPQFFSSLKSDCLFFNVGRGHCVDELALLQWLKTNPKAQAVIDVTVDEPLPAQHPFWSQSNLKLTPHCAAPSLSEQVCELLARNLNKYQAQLDLECIVDKALAY